MYFQRAVVTFPAGDFPMDMLRYDHCYPSDTESALLIGQCRHDAKLHREKNYVVQIGRVVQLKGTKWTVERWQSFGAKCKPTMETKV